MPKPVTEFFNAGLVTSRHPALLNPGELQRADDCVYREKDPAIWRAPGRTAYNGVSLGTKVKGLAHLTFDNLRTDQIIAHHGTTLYRSDFTALTGTFTEIGGPGQVTGAITGTNTFTATSGPAFLDDCIGARVRASGLTADCIITARTSSTIVTVSPAQTNATYTITLEHGLAQTLEDSGSEILGFAQWQSRYFMWFNHGKPRRLAWRARSNTSGATGLTDVLNMRPMGLDPVRTAPTLSSITGRWNTLFGTGYYWFIITEIFAPGADVAVASKDANLANEIVESAYLAQDPTSTDPNASIGRPVSIIISDTATQGVQLLMPAVTNTGLDGRLATNWGVYMAGPTADSRTAPSYATFKRIRTTSITQYTAGQTIDVSEPTIASQLVYASTQLGAGVYGKPQFNNPTNALGAPNKAYAEAKSGSATDGPGGQDAAIQLSGFSFNVAAPYATATIVGLQVQVTGAAEPAGNAGTKAGYAVNIFTASRAAPGFTSEFGSYGTNNHGGPLDTLGAAWTIADITTPALKINISKTGTGSRQRLLLDSVGVQVYFNGGTINYDGPAYKVVTYRDQVGTTVNDPANLPPPDCSTGDIFDGSLVLNSLSNESAIVYSLPGKNEAFPKPYFLQFESVRRDKVTNIKAINRTLIVGMRDSIKRVNYLPREVDTDFQQGLAHEDLATDHGIAGPLAAVKFDMPGAGSMLAYASFVGVYMTDGINIRPLNLDLDWTNTVNVANLSSCVMRVCPKDKWLILYYNPAGATHTENTKALVFSYAMDKVKEGGFLPCTGPITVFARGSAEANLSGANYILTGHATDGKVYVEDNGITQPSSYRVYGAGGALGATPEPISPFIRTRMIYGAGVERSEQIERLYLMYSKYGTTSTATGTTTRGSITITSAAAFGSVLPGMRVSGNNLDPMTIVLTASASSITVSREANASGSGTLTFDTGTLSFTVRGADLAEDTYALETSYVSTLLGHLFSTHQINTKLGIELDIKKVMLPDTSTVDLATNMRLHQFTYMISDAGLEHDRYTG